MAVYGGEQDEERFAPDPLADAVYALRRARG